VRRCSLSPDGGSTLADVVIPSLGESVTEGIIIQWYKSVGDRVERDEPLFEISTDKVDSEMPSPAAGVVTEILVEEGDTVAVGARVAVISDSATSTVPAASRPAFAEPDPIESPSSPESTTANQGFQPDADKVVASVSSPVVRRILASAGVDAQDVTGTGVGGRVTRADAERAAAASAPTTAAGSSAVMPSPRQAPEVLAGSSFGSRPPASPHSFLAIDADFSGVVAVLRSPAAVAAVAEGLELDHFVVAVRAAVEALGEHPTLNSIVDADNLLPIGPRNIGMAISFDGGLVVPVIANAQDLTLRGIAKRVADLKGRVASGELAIEDLVDGTFTVVPSAADDIAISVPTVLAPQVAILSVNAVRRQAVVISSDDGSDALVIRSIGRLGLSFDNRFIDSAEVAGFLSRIAELLAGQPWAAEL